MNNEKLRKLAEDVQAVIENYNVDVEMFALNITVTEEYFNLVKNDLQSNVSYSLFTDVY